MELRYPKHCPRLPLFPTKYKRIDFVEAAVTSIETNLLSCQTVRSTCFRLTAGLVSFLLLTEHMRISYLEQRRIGIDLFSLSEDSLLFLAHSVLDILQGA